MADIEVLNRLCEYFEVSADYLIGTADIAAINDFIATNKYFKSNPELDAKALEIYRLIKECFTSFQALHYNKYNLENCSDTDEYTSELCNILHTHLQIILSAYINLSENLLDGYCTDEMAVTESTIQRFMIEAETTDIQVELIKEIFKYTEIF